MIIRYLGIGVGTMGGSGGWCPPMFSDSYILYTLIILPLLIARIYRAPLLIPNYLNYGYRSLMLIINIYYLLLLL